MVYWVYKTGIIWGVNVGPESILVYDSQWLISTSPQDLVESGASLKGKQKLVGGWTNPFKKKY